jgi:hypothetical protein
MKSTGPQNWLLRIRCRTCTTDFDSKVPAKDFIICEGRGMIETCARSGTPQIQQFPRPNIVGIPHERILICESSGRMEMINRQGEDADLDQWADRHEKYRNRPGRNCCCLRDGWLRTGDIA